jgi:CRP-like cAMP-binding protein
MSAPVAHKQANKLLAALPASELERLTPYLDLVQLKLGTVLYEAGQPLRYAYFPADSIISLMHVMENGDSAEIAMVGHEGVAGISGFVGADASPSRAQVQSAGSAHQIDKEILKREFARGGTLQYILLRYILALIIQMGQTAACNRHHSVEQQLCRWLLLSLDRLPSNQLHMTQELIASMLGVRREGITEAAGRLQDAGIIKYSRGHITVLDRAKLESKVCECYAAVKKESDRLVGAHAAADALR